MKYGVSLTCIYNGYAEVEAESPEEAIQKVNEGLCGEALNGFPDYVETPVGGFSFGEATADYADPIA